MNHLVGLSGGKDSAAMGLKLKEMYPDRHYIYFCTPTGDELPEMEEHWTRLEQLLDAPILRLRDPDHGTIYDLIDEMHMLPNWRARWCTRILKIELAQQFYEFLKPATIYIGLRADETKRQGNKLYDEHIQQAFPLQEWGWGLKDVLAYLDKKGVKIPRRTDCAMCFYQRLDEWWQLWEDYPHYFQRLVDIEARLGHTLLSPGKWAKWPHALVDLRAEFEGGRKPLRVQTQDETGKCRACTL
ncbi:MAG: phosphoadenosine phosphosulfate reductase family protein [Candidatus Peribacteraceae bacterium]|nr:phosphoadenosine phosphosulfate reductase family protein [Candidatus Peribacteraceae bacterium]